jgi:hypothetical protein
MHIQVVSICDVYTSSRFFLIRYISTIITIGRIVDICVYVLVGLCEVLRNVMTVPIVRCW